MPRVLLLLLAACVRHGAGFVPSRLPAHSARPAAAAASGLRMMPLGIPKVPYRMPGSQQADWVDIYNRMYRERIIFLGETIDDQIVNQIIAVMLFADSEAESTVESAALAAPQLAAPVAEAVAGRPVPLGLGTAALHTLEKRLCRSDPSSSTWCSCHSFHDHRRACCASELPAPSLTTRRTRRSRSTCISTPRAARWSLASPCTTQWPT